MVDADSKSNSTDVNIVIIKSKNVQEFVGSML